MEELQALPVFLEALELLAQWVPQEPQVMEELQAL
jgi:hypothetical protein